MRIGNEFQKRKTSGRWKQYICQVEIPEIITPKIIEDIIKWAEEDDKGIVVESDGKNIVL